MTISQAKHQFQIIGDSELLDLAIERALKAAKTDIPIFINGPTGTGKEGISKIIHANSPRKHQPFLAINCGCLPETLIDVELFGPMPAPIVSANLHRALI